MDHSRLDEHHVADRYLMGQLDATERARFEEHFVDCPTCMEKLETVEGLRGGLKELTGERPQWIPRLSGPADPPRAPANPS